VFDLVVVGVGLLDGHFYGLLNILDVFLLVGDVLDAAAAWDYRFVMMGLQSMGL